jgi:methanethiol S-methyltransferase
VLIALRLEERDLLTFHGDRYEAYRQQVGMLLPVPRLHKPRQGPLGSDPDQLGN